MCRNLYSFVVYLYVNGSGSITSVGEEKANLSAVSVWEGFLFLWVLGMGYVILLSHSLSPPYNYFIMYERYGLLGHVNSPVKLLEDPKQIATQILFCIFNHLRPVL